MDQLLDARFSSEPRHPRGGCYMNRTEGVSFALHIETHGIHDAFDSRYGSGHGAIITDAGMDRLDAEPDVWKKGYSAFRMPRCDSYRPIALEQMPDDAAAEKARPAEYGHRPLRHYSIPMPTPGYGFVTNVSRGCLLVDRSLSRFVNSWPRREPKIQGGL
jgi:hypothetical protein